MYRPANVSRAVILVETHDLVRQFSKLIRVSIVPGVWCGGMLNGVPKI